MEYMSDTVFFICIRVHRVPLCREEKDNYGD